MIRKHLEENKVVYRFNMGSTQMKDLAFLVFNSEVVPSVVLESKVTCLPKKQVMEILTVREPKRDRVETSSYLNVLDDTRLIRTDMIQYIDIIESDSEMYTKIRESVEAYYTKEAGIVTPDKKKIIVP